MFSSLQLNFCKFKEVAILSIPLPQTCMGDKK